MIALKALRQNQSEVALKFAEQARSRTLLEAVSSSHLAEPLELARLRDGLPPAVAVMYYSVLENDILAWVIGHDEINFFADPSDNRNWRGSWLTAGLLTRSRRVGNL